MRCFSSSLFFLLGCSLAYPSSSSEPSVCEYTECKETASEILSNLNEKVDPCHDFYSYSCGGRSMNTMSLSKIETVLKQRLAKDLYADDNLKNHGSKAVRNMKKLYDDCNKEDLGNCEVIARFKCMFAFFRVYMDKYFPVAEHRAAMRLVSSLKNTFVTEILDQIEWIDLETKKLVLKNMTELKLNVGYPNWLVDDKELDLECQGVKHKPWSMDLLEVNAQYEPQGNGSELSKHIYQFDKISMLKCV